MCLNHLDPSHFVVRLDGTLHFPDGTLFFSRIVLSFLPIQFGIFFVLLFSHQLLGDPDFPILFFHKICKVRVYRGGRREDTPG
jgi:hypothetical protein